VDVPGDEVGALLAHAASLLIENASIASNCIVDGNTADVRD